MERLVRESGTWALVDELAPVVMGGLAERYPELTAVLTVTCAYPGSLAPAHGL